MFGTFVKWNDDSFIFPTLSLLCITCRSFIYFEFHIFTEHLMCALYLREILSFCVLLKYLLFCWWYYANGKWEILLNTFGVDGVENDENNFYDIHNKIKKHQIVIVVASIVMIGPVFCINSVQHLIHHYVQCSPLNQTKYLLMELCNHYIYFLLCVLDVFIECWLVGAAGYLTETFTLPLLWRSGTIIFHSLIFSLCT